MQKRDHIVSFVKHWSKRSELSRQQLLNWLDLPRGRFRDWERRFGVENRKNNTTPRAHWLLCEERQAIIDYAHQGHLQAGYRRMSYMMLDEDVVAVSPSSVYRVLKQADLIQKWRKPSKKGTGFDQPLKPHEHWHTDFTYLKLGGVFYYLACVLDGASRAILSWRLKPSMTEQDAQIVIQKAREAYPNTKPRIITDNGAQYTSQDFKEFISLCEMTHVKTAPYYPQSNGKIERFHGSIKNEAIRPFSPIDLEDAERIIGKYIHDYNNVRLHSAIGYIPPILKLEGRESPLLQERREKMEKASKARKISARNEVEKTFSSKEENDTNQLQAEKEMSRNPAGGSSCTSEQSTASAIPTQLSAEALSS